MLTGAELCSVASCTPAWQILKWSDSCLVSKFECLSRALLIRSRVPLGGARLALCSASFPRSRKRDAYISEDMEDSKHTLESWIRVALSISPFCTCERDSSILEQASNKGYKSNEHWMLKGCLGVCGNCPLPPNPIPENDTQLSHCKVYSKHYYCSYSRMINILKEGV